MTTWPNGIDVMLSSWLFGNNGLGGRMKPGRRLVRSLKQAGHDRVEFRKLERQIPDYWI